MKNSENNMSEVIQDCINNPIVQFLCTRQRNMDYKQKEKVEKELSRALGYCILFKSTEDIEQYMLIGQKEEQIEFLKRKIAQRLGIPEGEMQSRKKEIALYAFKNFVMEGYVFHGANSASIAKKLQYGLNGNNTDYEQKKQLLDIANIYLKYGNDKPLGWGVLDIKAGNNGWFYDGRADNITDYANSPEWFRQFCGENHAYAWGNVPEERRHGYANRDYETCLETITAIIDKNQMSENDKNKIISFFNSCWDKFGNTGSGLLLIPIKEVKTGKKYDDYCTHYMNLYSEDEKAQEYLFGDIISCNVTGQINVQCRESIPPDNLVAVDLTPILPRFKVERNQEQQITLSECMRMLRGFDFTTLKEAERMLHSLGIKEAPQSDII